MENNYNRMHEVGQSGKTGSIVSLLRRGKENAISTKELVRMAECGTVRELQARIAKERGNGAVICSGSGAGYWLPKNRKEIEDFCTTMEKRAKNIFNAVRSARKALELPEGQQQLEE